MRHLTRALILGLALGLAASAASAAPGQPFGGDATGTIPPDSPKGPITKCEIAVAKLFAKSWVCLTSCNALQAAGKLADAAANQACQDSCSTKYLSAAQKLLDKNICPACLSQAQLMALGGSAESTVDQLNGLFFCAS